MKKLLVVLAALMFVNMLAACGTPTETTTSNGAPSGTLEISVLYGSEKKLWMDDVVKQFNAQQTKSTSGKPIFVTATAIGSNESLTQILNGQAQPTVWSPASGVLIPVANEQWAAAHGGAKLVDGAQTPLLLSPVVIAMWEPMAKALGWPNTPIGWGDIAKLAASGKQWADYGHPEWGRFSLAIPTPITRTAGLSASWPRRMRRLAKPAT